MSESDKFNLLDVEKFKNALQCDAPYRGHPTNIFTSKKLANQGTRI